MGFLKRIFGGTEAAGGAVPQASPRRDIGAADLAAMLKQSPAPYLLDVREPHEYADGHIAGATLMPLGELARRIGELPRDREIVCVCRSGNRSGVAARHLVGAGYNVANLSGGMIGWSHAGLPVRRGARA
jgi:rhodanese-related sulfurtransferase